MYIQVREYVEELQMNRHCAYGFTRPNLREVEFLILMPSERSNTLLQAQIDVDAIPRVDPIANGMFVCTHGDPSGGGGLESAVNTNTDSDINTHSLCFIRRHVSYRNNR